METLYRSVQLFKHRIGRLRALLALPLGGRCAEIGVWKGDFSRRILQIRRPKELHLVDPWLFSPHYPRRLYGGTGARNQDDMDRIMALVVGKFSKCAAVQIHRNSSTEIARRFPDHYFDWIYIDADHSYEAVLCDLKVWHEKVRPGGVIALDDYRWRDEQNRQSVKGAIESFLFCTEVKSAREVYGQFLIRKS
jgi:SAM-dependent methyltransferase